MRALVVLAVGFSLAGCTDDAITPRAPDGAADLSAAVDFAGDLLAPACTTHCQGCHADEQCVANYYVPGVCLKACTTTEDCPPGATCTSVSDGASALSARVCISERLPRCRDGFSSCDYFESIRCDDATTLTEYGVDVSGECGASYRRCAGGCFADMGPVVCR
jgi:hypothetical protein